LSIIRREGSSAAGRGEREKREKGKRGTEFLGGRGGRSPRKGREALLDEKGKAALARERKEKTSGLGDSVSLRDTRPAAATRGGVWLLPF